jgi:hypothetical protein
LYTSLINNTFIPQALSTNDFNAHNSRFGPGEGYNAPGGEILPDGCRQVNK